jgi:hypothetical protein
MCVRLRVCIATAGGGTFPLSTQNLVKRKLPQAAAAAVAASVTADFTSAKIVLSEMEKLTTILKWIFMFI